MFASRRHATVIAKGLKVVGNIEAEGSVELNGQIEGELHCTVLFISHTAEVTGTVDADRVIVDGKIQGPIRGGDVLLKSKARVRGDIHCNTLTVEKGACVEGRLVRVPDSNADTTKRLDLASREESKEEANTLSEAETSTRIAELVVEARHLSGNPSLLADEAIAFLARRGNVEAKSFLKPAKTSGKDTTRPHQ